MRTFLRWVTFIVLATALYCGLTALHVPYGLILVAEFGFGVFFGMVWRD